MTAFQYLSSLNLKEGCMLPLAKLMYPKCFNKVQMTHNVGLPQIKSCLRRMSDVKPYPFAEYPFELMNIVNLMTRDKNMPHNLINRFHRYKHNIIKKAMEDGFVTEIYEEGNLYSFLINGEYKFHQLKTAFKEPLECCGEREKSVSDDMLSFNEKQFKEFQINAIKYLGTNCELLSR